MAETAQAGMPVNDLDLFANDDIAENREEGEDGWHSRLAVYNEERDVVNLEPIGKVPDPSASFVGMGDDNDFVTAINKFLRPMSIASVKGISDHTVDNW